MSETTRLEPVLGLVNLSNMRTTFSRHPVFARIRVIHPCSCPTIVSAGSTTVVGLIEICANCASSTSYARMAIATLVCSPAPVWPPDADLTSMPEKIAARFVNASKVCPVSQLLAASSIVEDCYSRVAMRVLADVIDSTVDLFAAGRIGQRGGVMADRWRGYGCD